ncbi:MAG: DNA-binding Lrp family transcriptional regulator [Alphaproteobacteria bacterium]|jgi:DNA-binding Lrp family transcriptional regulator
MDQTDRNIIRALQKNARMTNQELADTVNLSPSPCLRRVRSLEHEGIIRSYTLEVDNEAFGLPVTVFVRVQLEKHTQDVVAHFETKIKEQENVLECFVMTGRADYLLKVVVKDLHDYENFVRHSLHSIGSIASIDTSFAYGVVKKTTLLPDHHIL